MIDWGSMPSFKSEMIFAAVMMMTSVAALYSGLAFGQVTIPDGYVLAFESDSGFRQYIHTDVEILTLPEANGRNSISLVVADVLMVDKSDSHGSKTAFKCGSSAVFYTVWASKNGDLYRSTNPIGPLIRGSSGHSLWIHACEYAKRPNRK